MLTWDLEWSQEGFQMLSIEVCRWHLLWSSMLPTASLDSGECQFMYPGDTAVFLAKAGRILA